MDSYMASYEYCFIINRNLHQAHLQEVVLTQIMANHVNGTAIK